MNQDRKAKCDSVAASRLASSTRPNRISRAALLVILVSFCVSLLAEERDWNRDEIDEVLEKATASMGQATDVRDRVSGVPDLIEAANQFVIDRNLKDYIDQLRPGMSEAVARENQGFREFLNPDGKCGEGSACACFREELRMIFDGMQMLSNELLSMGPPPGSGLMLDFTGVRTTMDNTPDRFLYPLFRATQLSIPMESESNGPPGAECVDVRSILNGIGQWFLRQGEALVYTKNILQAPVHEQCELVAVDPEGLERSSFILKSGSIAIRLLGEVMVSKSGTGITNFQVGLMGYVALNQQLNNAAKVGKIITGLSQALGLMSDQATFVHRYCTLVENEALFIDLIEATSYPGQGGGPR